MSNTLKTTGVLVAAILLVGLGLTLWNIFPVFSSAPSGLPARQAIATTTQVGPQETVTIFSNKANCSSRVVSTTDGTGQAIQLLFGEPTNGDIASASLSEVVGNLQAGSTTVAYDSGIYGCGSWSVDAPASTTLLLTEFN